MTEIGEAVPEARDFIRLPGLFRRWELEDVLEVGKDFHLESAGSTEDGTELLAVYCRGSSNDREMP